jgi:outer membrane immunogenic protein
MNNRAISIVSGATFILAASGSAFAADMAVKAPPAPSPEPVFSWTGFYVGGNLGASFGRAQTNFSVAPAPVTVNTGAVGVFNSSVTVNSSLTGFAGSDTVYPSGFMGGGQVGYNWQFSPLLVAGLEADFQGADEKESATPTNPFSVIIPLFGPFTGPPSIVGVTGTTIMDYQTKIDWFGTVRGRIGYLWGNGAVMSYVTGGLAYGEVKVDGTSAVSGTVGSTPLFIPLSITQAFSHSNVNTGWTVGSGTEGRLLIPGWTYRIEALYMDLGTLSNSVSGGQIITHTHFTDSILRAGLNYQFH